jgi:hypothetical protein
MAVSANMLAFLRTPAPAVQRYFTLTLPADAGGTMRLSDRGVRDSDGNWHEPRVTADGGMPKGYGGIRLATSDANGNHAPLEFTLEIYDEDGRIPAPGVLPFSVGPFGRGAKLAQCKGSSAQLRIGSPSLATADYYTAFTGILYNWTKTGDRTWTLNMKVDDDALKRPVPHLKLSQTIWPNAFRASANSQGAGDVLGLFFPVVMGLVSSAGLGNNGLRRTYYVDTVQHWWLVSLGVIGATGFHVYVNGIELVTGWTRLNVVQQGYTCTVVQFPSGTITMPDGTTVAAADAIVTVDCQGIDLGSYGTYTNAANQLRFIQENLVWGDWNGAATDIVSPTRTDTSTFTQMAADLAALETAPVIGGAETSAGELLRQYNEALGTLTWFNEAGQIAGSVWDPAMRSTLYIADPVILERPDVLANLGLVQPQSQELVDGLDVSYLTGSTGAAQQSITVFHPRRLTSTPKALDNRWGPGRAA